MLNVSDDTPLLDTPPYIAAPKLIVAIPARNEAETIVRCLTAFAEQCDVEPNTFSVVLLANNCTDDTVARARAFARSEPHLDLAIIEMTFEREQASVGRARGAGMNLAARRFAELGVDGIIATTDADTVVDPAWIANTIAAMRDVDAVAGRIDLLAEDRSAMPVRARVAYEQMRRYAGAVATLEATLDPTLWDPSPRHPDNFGGSFAVRASAYRLAGGIPDRERLEDLALYLALLREDFQVRHATTVRVATSGRRAGRVTGGLASFLDALSNEDRSLVEDPQTTIENITARAALRRYVKSERAVEIVRICAALGIPQEMLLDVFDPSAAFGRNWEAVEKAALPYRSLRDPVDVEIAIAGITFMLPATVV